MSAIDRTIRLLEHDLEMAKLGKRVDVDRVEASLVRLRKERAEEFARWLDSLPKPTFTMPVFRVEHLDWLIIPMGMDETFEEAQERANKERGL